MPTPTRPDGDMPQPGEEITPIDALINFSRMLDERQDADDRETMVSVHLIRQASLLLLDYRRTLEIVAALQLTAMLPRQREAALDAYQTVCQRVALVVSVLDNSLKLQGCA